MQVEQYLRQRDSLKNLRRPHEETWRQCYLYSYPVKASGFYGDDYDAREAQSKRAALVDSTSTKSCRILASAIMSGMTPANALWFALDAGSEQDDERRWLDDAAKLLWENIHLSNFDSAGYESILDCVIAGWFVLYIDEAEDGGFMFEQWDLPSCYLAASKPGGLIDTIYREFMLTAEQAYNTYGDELSADTIKLAKDKPSEMVEFVQCIQPRTIYVTNPKLAKNMPFASIHIECKQKKVVRESGYHEFPCVAPRWLGIPRTAYAVGPMFDALPDVKELCELKRMNKAAAELTIAGMWIAEDDGVLNPRTVKVGPRKIIVANSVDSMKPLETGGNWQLSEVMIADLQRSIREALMADQLQPQDGPAMTATEVHVRVGLIRQLLGPVYGRMQSEYLQPLIERCFGIAYRAGIFPPPPESLIERNFNVRYTSPLSRAQKLEEVTAIERLHMNIAQVAQVMPEVLDLVDEDQAIRVMSDALGVPNKVIRDENAVEVVREQRKKQQAEAQQQAMAQQLQQTAGEEVIKSAVGK